MAAPPPAVALPGEIKHYSLALETKPGASIHYTLAQSKSADPPCLVVFLNGLMSDKSSWLLTMAGIIRADPDFPSMLAYDRYGQGLTEDHDPRDRGHEDGYGHDADDAALDLHQFVKQVCKDHLDKNDVMPRLILVANSIGCAIARLVARREPAVIGMVLLDSIMTNSNFDFWPDPDAPRFDASQLPVDVTIEILREQRAKFKAMFGPETKNRESFDRRNLATLLPASDHPRLIERSEPGPFVTVVGHDFETFAAEGLRSMGTPISLTMKYTNPVWHEYNIGLTKLTNPERAKGPLIAPGCGHFIQRDNPGFVVDRVLQMLQDIQGH